MARICKEAEQHPRLRQSSHRIGRRFDYIDEAIAMASCISPITCR